MRKMFGVGINVFQDPSSNLSGCVNDTANIRELCVNGKNLLIEPEQIRLVCDQRATRASIYERLDWCGREWPTVCDPRREKLVIQFSCHGTQVVDRDGDEVGDQQDEALCPYDYPDLWDSPDSAPDLVACEEFLRAPPKPLICDDDLAVFLKRIPKGVYTVLIVDACHSGTVDRAIDRVLKNPVKSRFIRPPFDIASRGMDRKLPVRKFGAKRGSIVRDLGNPNVHYIEQNHILLSGCRDDQTSSDAYINGQSQGAMTWSFLEALKELGYYEDQKPSWIQVHQLMLELLIKGGYAQKPQLTGSESLLHGPVFGD